MSVYYIASLLE